MHWFVSPRSDLTKTYQLIFIFFNDISHLFICLIKLSPITITFSFLNFCRFSWLIALSFTVDWSSSTFSEVCSVLSLEFDEASLLFTGSVVILLLSCCFLLMLPYCFGLVQVIVLHFIFLDFLQRDLNVSIYLFSFWQKWASLPQIHLS